MTARTTSQRRRGGGRANIPAASCQATTNNRGRALYLSILTVLLAPVDFEVS